MFLLEPEHRGVGRTARTNAFEAILRVRYLLFMLGPYEPRCTSTARLCITQNAGKTRVYLSMIRVRNSVGT